ncbi:MAG TPA: DUF1553 domain-containing protein [Prosthecobacter sp.]|nr:DUF1553 domain-containing protein [Prosthecobacter sp.]
MPNGETSCVRRVKSNTPLQALMTLNETLSMDAARALGQRMLKEGGDSDEARLTYGFKLCTARTPTNKELRILADMLRRQQPTERAYTLAARVLLNLDETITKE